MRQVLPVLAWGGAGFSLLVHVTTWFGVDVFESTPVVWILLLGVAVFLLPLSLTRRVRIGSKMQNPYLTTLMPDWMERLIAVVWVYACVIGLVSLYLIRTGADAMRDTYALRCYTAAAIFFFLTPALPFWYRRDKMKREDIARELHRGD